MKVKPGYKQTEVGVIPEGWVVRHVCELGKVVTGGTPSTSIPDFWNGSHPWITPTDISDKRDMIESQRMISDAGLRTIRSIPGNSILVTCIASIGKNAILRRMGGCNQQINAVIPYDEQNSEFLFYLFESAKNFLLANAGTTATSIVSKSTFGQLAFAIPPLPEQTAIAAVLSDVDALLEALDRLIAKKRDLKQATMQQLLTGQIRLPGFGGKKPRYKQTEVGVIPEDWELLPLGEVAEIRKGQLITERSIRPGPVPVVAGGKKPAYYHDTSNRTGKTITVSASGANAGFVDFYSVPFFASDCCTISEASTYSVEFIYFFLQSQQHRIYRAQTGGAQPHVHANDLAPLVLHIPPLPEQTAIAAVISDMDAEITALEARRTKTQNLKQAMMQELLTGKTRLVYTETEAQAPC